MRKSGKHISTGFAPKGAKDPNIVFFADSYSSWQKGAIENANKLIRQYIPKGTDFSTLTDAFIRKIQCKINRRSRKKLNFESPKTVFFRRATNFAVARLRVGPKYIYFVNRRPLQGHLVNP